MTHRLGLTALILGLAACQPSHLKDERTPTGSATVAASSDYRSLYTVSPLDGLVVRRDLDGQMHELELDGEPTRIARIGDEQLAVTLRADRSIAVLDITADGPPELVRTVKAGAEPYGLVATEDGSRVYVALSQEDRVLELDGDTWERLRSWSTPDEPRWLGLHPSEKALFVVCGVEAEMVRIDLRLDDDRPPGVDDVETLAPPTISREIEGDDWVDLTPRWTGDPSLSPIGDAIYVPGLYVDNTSGPSSAAGTVGSTGSSAGYYMATAAGVSRTNPVVVGYRLDWKTGEVLDSEEPLPIFLAATVGARSFETVRSYPSSVTVAPTGDRALVTMEASRAVAMVDLEPARFQGDSPRVSDNVFEPDVGSDGMPFTRIDEAGLYERAVVGIDVPAGPIGAAFLDDTEAWVWSSIDRKVSDLDYEIAHRQLRELSADMASGFFSAPELSARRRLDAGTSRLPDAVEEGRRLFFDATDSRMAGAGAGVSCSTCHFEGRNDGLTWNLEVGPRQTPSLAGEVSRTAPVTWTDDVDSVAHEAQLTSELRMGGSGLSRDDARAIEAFVDFTREVDVADKGATSALVELGAEVYHRPEVGCATCHPADGAFTDNALHDLYGLRGVNTPSLVGIAATAPYLHDGSAKSLRAVLETARTGQMGDTSSLTDEELDALEAYLKTL